jgi:transcription-repair coupling factor (superfamily II helicase)
MILFPLLSLLRKTDEYYKVYRDISAKKNINISGLKGSSKAYLLSTLTKDLDTSMIIITPRIYEAEQLYADMQTFYNNDCMKYFPSLEVLPYEVNPPNEELIGQRFSILDILLQVQKKIVIVTSIHAVIYRITKPEDILTLYVSTGMEISRDTILNKLVGLGYEKVTMTEEKGDFSYRGGIIDIFPVTGEYPIRIELIGDTIDTIRQFDPITQRSISFLEEVKIVACTDTAIEKTSTIFDYLPEDYIVVVDNRSEIEAEYKRLEKETWELYREALDQYHNKKENIVPPNKLMIDINDIFSQRQILDLNACYKDNSIEFNINSSINTGGKIELFIDQLKRYYEDGYIIIISANYPGQAERIQELLDEYNLNAKVNLASGRRMISPDIVIVVSSLVSGFEFPDIQVMIISDQEIFGRQRILRRRRFVRAQSMPIETYFELKPGDFVVHVNYGIGIYRGLTTTKVDGNMREFLLIEYAQGDKLYIPVDQLSLIQKYIGSKDQPPQIHRLHDHTWERTKTKVKKAVETMAKELLEIYAARKALPGYAFSKDTPWQYEFESGFIYEETPDQLKAIENVKKDMEDISPMDRLICGDVGYGKTEVAVRAAFKAIMDGKQVAVLVPTTILAFQHYSTFSERFAGFPVNIQMLSRFKSRREQTEIISEISKGRVDIVIGTHRLLQKDVTFSNLGLIIIDEEHRFGVRHKEKLKALRKLVDVLTLTATPIPRTLYMALCGVRDMSIIQTAPPGRLPIKTVITKFDNDIIREAVLREMDRGGQIFFVHNQVKTIPYMFKILSEIIPEARIIIAHGQMEEKELEKNMLEFMNGKFDILLASSIIESGLDMPRVNTIIINNAHKFGLAQLYQLRGRVGRAQHRAYAYLLYPSHEYLSQKARERLKAIMEFSELGSGFKLAMRDLEIRGAGNILGPQQHGHVAAVGFDMYCKLLEEAVSNLKGIPVKEQVVPQIALPCEGYIPEEYIPEMYQRLQMYKKLASATSEKEIQNIKEELIDRFGKYPEPVKWLLELMNIRMLAVKCNITTISTIQDKIYITLPTTTELIPKIVAIVNAFPKKVSINSSQTNQLILVWEGKEVSIKLLKNILTSLVI